MEKENITKLTDEEKEAVKAGADIKFNIVVKDEVKAGDKELIDTKISSLVNNESLIVFNNSGFKIISVSTTSIISFKSEKLLSSRISNTNPSKIWWANGTVTRTPTLTLEENKSGTI